MQTKMFYILFFTFFSLTAYSQYKISGYLDTKEPKMIYLSILRFDEQNAQSKAQIIETTQTDSLGYFEITGNLLSPKDKFYRIHACFSNNVVLELTKTPEKINHQNFILSNTDTVFFGKNESTRWFQERISTNQSDNEIQKVKSFSEKLKQQFDENANPEELDRIRMSYLKESKEYCNDSVVSPLVCLLVYADLKIELGDNLKNDFNKNPEFYYSTLYNLKKYYGGNSYYTQFQEEISSLSHSQIKKKYSFHKFLNIFLFVIIIGLSFIVFKLTQNKKLIENSQLDNQISTLSQQEENIVGLLQAGLTNKEIANKLFISISTVKTHITNIYAKLDVSNRQQLIDKLKNHTKY